MVTGYKDAWGSPISHHADRLGEALGELGVEVTRFARPEWGPRTLREVLAAATERPTTVHLQYPMLAMGRSVVPALLAARTRAVVTVHEASTVGKLLGRGKIIPAVARASAVVFTNEFERAFVLKYAPWVRGRSTVIPIGSNIPGGPGGTPEAGRIVGFGTIRPSSGWEQFADFARLAKDSHPGWTIVAVGRTAASHEAYRAEIIARAAGSNLEFSGELAAEAVGGELARGMVAYIPFHDGASERRSSLLAAMANGVPVVSNAGRHTSAELRASVALATSPEEAVTVIARLMADDAERARLAAAGRAYADARSWPIVARRYLEIYRSIGRA